MSAQATQTVWVCTTRRCIERMRGVCDEPTFCSICQEDLKPVHLGSDGLGPKPRDPAKRSGSQKRKDRGRR